MLNDIKKLIGRIQFEANAEVDAQNRAEGMRLAKLLLNYFIGLPEGDRLRCVKDPSRCITLSLSMLDNSYTLGLYAKKPDVTIVIKPFNQADMEGEFEKKGNNNKIRLFLCYSDFENTDEINEGEFINVFTHEFIHYKKYITGNYPIQAKDGADYKSYLSNPDEFDSFSQGIMAELDGLTRTNFKDFNEFLRYTAVIVPFLKSYLDGSDEKYKKKLISRLYQYYTHKFGGSDEQR